MRVRERTRMPIVHTMSKATGGAEQVRSHIALTSAYFCQRQAMPVQVRTEDIMRQLVHLRPYPEPGTRDRYQAIYAASHTVYVLNDYGRARLSSRLLPLERAFLERNMSWALAQGEPDTVGEIIDSLLALGVADRHPLIVAGRTLLMDTQQADGGWGDEADDYGRFHTLWTAIDELRDHAWPGRGLNDHALRRALPLEILVDDPVTVLHCG